MGALLDRLFDGAFWDWKPITAAGIWALLSIQSNLRAVSLITDEVILNHYDKSRTPQSPLSKT